MQPSQISVPADRRSIHIEWPDGIQQEIKAPTLRRLSRSAQSQSARISGNEAPVDPGLTIATVQPVGVYAITVAFSDGYAKGIFPWELLRSAIGALAFQGKTAADPTVSEPLAIS